MWADTAGRKLTLSPVAMVTLCDKERQVLQMVAMATLQAMKLGLHLPKLKSKSLIYIVILHSLPAMQFPPTTN